jgi:hypothetical protein
MSIRPVIRQSTLETARCLYRFHKIHVEGVQEFESEFAQRGTDFHQMGKLYVDYLVATQQEMDWEAADRIASNSGVVTWNQDAIDLFLPWSRERVFEPSKIVATEYEIRLNADGTPCFHGDHRYSCDLDRLEIEDGHAEIFDYKSHFGVFNPTTIQSVVYPWMLWQIMPDLKSITFTLDFVRWGIFRSRTFEREQFARMDSFIRNQVQRLETAFERDEWPAEVNSKCAYCRLECPLVGRGLTEQSIGQIKSAEHASAMAQQVFAMRQASARMMASLRAYALTEGPVMKAGSDLRLGFKKQNRTAYKVRTIQGLNDKHGFDPNRALAVDSSEIRRIGRDYPDYVTEAKKTARDTSSTKFTFWSESGDPLEVEDDDGID